MEAAATSPFINSAHHYHGYGDHHHTAGGGGGSKRMCNFGEPETGSILDPFQIEDLLDFSNEDIAGPIGDEPVVLSNSSSSQLQQQQISSTNNSSVTAVSSVETKPDIGIATSSEFPIDCGDMPELEWLSNLVEDDSFMDKSVFGGGRCTPVSTSVANVGNNNNNNNNAALTKAATTTTTANTNNAGNGLKRQHSTTAALLEESSNTNNNSNNNKGADRFQVGSPISVLESSSATSGGRLGVKEMAVPGRPRSKRMRTGVNSWKNSPPTTTANGSNNTMNSNTMANMGTNNTNTTNNTNSCSPDTSSVSDYNNNKSDQHDSGFSLDNSSEQDVVDSRPLEEQPQQTITVAPAAQQQHAKQQYSSSTQASKGKPPLLKSGSGGGGGGGAAVGSNAAGGAAGQEPRRCTHCLSQKTPQWRAGPEGPKTLCNACGVRYKSGRLYPEYRPALSPTFVSDMHSNSHRKVLEMRKQKAQQQAQQFQAQQGEVLDDGEQLLIYK